MCMQIIMATISIKQQTIIIMSLVTSIMVTKEFINELIYNLFFFIWILFFYLLNFNKLLF